LPTALRIIGSAQHGQYVLDHHLEGRLAAGVDVATTRPDAPSTHRVARRGAGLPGVEVGCGNGSISAWLAEQVGARGQVVAFDLDLSLVDVRRTSS
jgi:2-polyprenyl-3-methyl-5-hydroxy-6-metoxy-1,4-benzoquinol methylase